MWFVTTARPSGIAQDQPVSRPECRRIAALKPIFQTLRKAVVKHQSRARTLDLIMDMDSRIVCVWHLAPSLCSGVTESSRGSEAMSIVGNEGASGVCQLVEIKFHTAVPELAGQSLKLTQRSGAHGGFPPNAALA